MVAYRSVLKFIFFGQILKIIKHLICEHCDFIIIAYFKAKMISIRMANLFQNEFTLFQLSTTMDFCKKLFS